MIVLDTGVLFAATDRRDAHHSASAALLDSRVDDVVILPVPVLVETAWLVQRRLGARVEARLIAAAAAGDFTLHDLTPGDWQRVHGLLEAYHDLDLGTVDASVVATAERYGATEIATLNHRDFTVVRPQHTEAFVLHPQPTRPPDATLAWDTAWDTRCVRPRRASALRAASCGIGAGERAVCLGSPSS